MSRSFATVVVLDEGGFKVVEGDGSAQTLAKCPLWTQCEPLQGRHRVSGQELMVCPPTPPRVGMEGQVGGTRQRDPRDRGREGARLRPVGGEVAGQPVEGLCWRAGGQARSRETRVTPPFQGDVSRGREGAGHGCGSPGQAGRGSPCCLGRPACLCGCSHLLPVCHSWPQAWLACHTACWLGLAGADGPSFWSLLFKVGALGLERYSALLAQAACETAGLLL